MGSRMLVTGGTGTLGRLVVSRLRAAEREVRVLSRTRHDDAEGVEFVVGDLTSGEGADAAVAGVETVVHLAGTAKGDEVKARALIGAASRAGVQHVVFISVVGAERVPVRSRTDRAMFGYFASKRAAEQLIEDSGLGWSTLRATQFYDAILTVVRGMGKMPVVPAPTGFRFQPVDTGEVAERVVELALGAPVGLVHELGGPRAYELKELARSYLQARHKHRLIVPVRMPGGSARAIREGANLPLGRPLGHRTWEEFLSAQVGAPRSSETEASPPGERA